MTFGAMAAWQAWLLLAGAAGIAAWVFLLKLRPPRVIVPSLLLWRRVLDEVRDITLWERIRRAVSLIVTIVIALALAFAVTRPSPRASASAAAGDRRLIVIDSSWSMLARTRAGERRWDRGLAEARRLIASGGDIALATTADGIVEGPTTDLALLDTALDRIAPSGGDAATWPRLSDSDSVHFITDGAMARPAEANVVVHSVFEPASNVAITALDVRPSVGSANAGDAYLEIANYAASPQKVRVMLARGSDSVLDRRIDIGAGETLRQVIPLARGADEILRAHIEAPANALEIDDEAWGWVGGSRPLKLTVVSQHPEWLKALFDHDPSVHATVLDPSAYGASPIDADVVIFDRWAPHDAPAQPSLFFAPPLDTPWLSGDSQPAPAAPEERRPRWDVVGEHPIVRGVDPFTLIIEKARGYRSASLVSIAQSTRGTPLVSIAESPERRLVLVSFGPQESNLTAAPGFPVLVGNALEWLAHPATGLSRRPGLMSFDGAIAKVTGPDGAAVPLVRVNHGSVGRLRTPGVYVAEGGGARSAVAVNVGDPQTSNLQRTSGGTTRNVQIVTAGASGWPWWIYCAVLAFTLAVVEWWTWQRRITV